MPASCAVPKCRNRRTVHRFPSDGSRSRQWLTAIKRESFTPNKHTRICRDHFKPEDYELPKESVRTYPLPRLKSNAVPNIFKWTKNTSSSVPEAKSIQEVSSGLESPTNLFFRGEQFYSSLVSSIESTFDRSCGCGKIVGTGCFGNLIRIHKLRNNIKDLQYYTGLEDYNHFLFILSVLGDCVNHLYYFPYEKGFQHRRIMEPPDELLLTLVKLCRNMSFEELEHRFGVNKTEAVSIFITYVNLMYCVFKEVDLLGKYSASKECMFFTDQENASLLVQCSEFKIAKPSNPLDSQLTYSPSKDCNSVKVLIGTSLSGVIKFVSDAYGGSLRNNEIFQKEFSSIAECFEDKDIIAYNGRFQVNYAVDESFFIIYKCVDIQSQYVPRVKNFYKVSFSGVQVERTLGSYRMLSAQLCTSDIVFARVYDLGLEFSNSCL